MRNLARNIIRIHASIIVQRIGRESSLVNCSLDLKADKVGEFRTEVSRVFQSSSR